MNGRWVGASLLGLLAAAGVARGEGLDALLKNLGRKGEIEKRCGLRVTETRVYVALNSQSKENSRFLVVDRATGKILATVPFDVRLELSGALFEKTVMIKDALISLEDGSTVTTKPAKNEFGRTLAAGGGMIYGFVPSNDPKAERLLGVDPATGEVAWSAPVPRTKAARSTIQALRDGVLVITTPTNDKKPAHGGRYRKYSPEGKGLWDRKLKKPKKKESGEYGTLVVLPAPDGGDLAAVTKVIRHDKPGKWRCELELLDDKKKATLERVYGFQPIYGVGRPPGDGDPWLFQRGKTTYAVMEGELEPPEGESRGEKVMCVVDLSKRKVVCRPKAGGHVSAPGGYVIRDGQCVDAVSDAPTFSLETPVSPRENVYLSASHAFDWRPADKKFVIHALDGSSKREVAFSAKEATFWWGLEVEGQPLAVLQIVDEAGQIAIGTLAPSDGEVVVRHRFPKGEKATVHAVFVDDAQLLCVVQHDGKQRAARLIGTDLN